MRKRSTGKTRSSLVLVAFFSLFAASWAMAQNAFIIAIDKTGSMGSPSTVCGPSKTRCECATERALEGSAGIFAGDPSAPVAVVTFPPAQVLQAFTSDKALVDAAVSTPCTGGTPLADAACLSGDTLGARPEPNRFLLLLTDGEENSSVGPCSGPFSTVLDVPPYDVGSWHNEVFANLTANAVVDVGLFGPIGAIQGTPIGQTESDFREPGAENFAPEGAVSDASFFQAMASATGGTLTYLADTGEIIVDPLISKAIPTLSEWGIVMLVSLLLIVGVVLLARRRRGLMAT